MSLVAYESSDNDSEEEKNPKSVSTIQKKTKEAVKIRIPSLKEFEDEDDVPPVKKPKMKSGSGSGLFSLLPPPKNVSKSSKPEFVPYVLSSKKEQPSSTSKADKNSKSTTIPIATDLSKDSDEEISLANDKLSEENNTAPVHNDFFWLDDLASNSRNEQENVITSTATEENNTFIKKLSPQESSISCSSTSGVSLLDHSESNVFSQEYPHKSTETNTFEAGTSSLEMSSYVGQSNLVENVPLNESKDEFHTKEHLLKDKEFLKLQGRRSEFENIDIIDVRADDQLTGKNEWLVKGLTEETTHVSSRKKHNMPTQQQKRKHQITYLAFQAKERENDLKNQWALNSRTRRETQAKYGF